MANSDVVHVAVGVIINGDGAIYISRRHSHLHQGGKWEFPGGKLEAHENVMQALHRELQEECGIEVEEASPLTVIEHDYGDKKVRLDVWQITAFNGQITQCDGQEWCWVARHELAAYPFPAANQAIIDCLQQSILT